MTTSQFIDINWDDKPTHIEYQWVGSEDSTQPLIVFLHEGLGSVAMWKDFPQLLCETANCRGLIYSRPGYGQSTPREKSDAWQPDFMHRQAFEVLPSLFEALGINTNSNPPWLFGHSDGGSIALLFAARYPMNTSAAIVVAPHIFVEDICISSIEEAKIAYLTTTSQATDLRCKLACYHNDVDSAFLGWNDVWLSPAFRHWNLSQAIKTITCPLLAIQGLDDEYGSLEQIRSIKRILPKTTLLEIPNCGHSPHRDQPDTLIRAVTSFIRPQP
jgi:pimeloyl-ACP methyl ester carboxylesterase